MKIAEQLELLAQVMQEEAASLRSVSTRHIAPADMREAARLLRRAEEVLRPFAERWTRIEANNSASDWVPTTDEYRAAAALLRELEGRKP